MEKPLFKRAWPGAPPLDAEKLETCVRPDTLARMLIRLGYEKVSNRYRHLARVPSASEILCGLLPSAIDEVRSHYPDMLEQHCPGFYRRVFAGPHGLCVAVSIETFRAFKELGGRTAE